MFSEIFYVDESSPSGLRWKVSRGKVKSGDIAGSLYNTGYWVVNTKGKGYGVHRVIAILSGIITSDSNLEVDHIDRDRSNNKLSNLRAVTKSQNMKNIGIMKSNKSGVAGVSWVKRSSKWRADISHCNKDICLGFFPTILDAVAARLRAVKEYGGVHATRPV